MQDNSSTTSQFDRMIREHAGGQVAIEAVKKFCVFRGGFTYAAAQYITELDKFQLNGALGLLRESSFITYDVSEDRYNVDADLCHGVNLTREIHSLHFDYFFAFSADYASQYNILLREVENLEKALQWGCIFQPPLEVHEFVSNCLTMFQLHRWKQGLAWLERLKKFDYVPGSIPWIVLYGSWGNYYLSKDVEDYPGNLLRAYQLLQQVSVHVDPTVHHELFVWIRSLLGTVQMSRFELDADEDLLQNAYSHFIEAKTYSKLNDGYYINLHSQILKIYVLFLQYYGEVTYLDKALEICDELCALYAESKEMWIDSADLFMRVADTYQIRASQIRSVVYQRKYLAKSLKANKIALTVAPDDPPDFRISALITYAYACLTISATKSIEKNLAECKRSLDEALQLVEQYEIQSTPYINDVKRYKSEIYELKAGIHRLRASRSFLRSKREHREKMLKYYRLSIEHTPDTQEMIHRSLTYASVINKFGSAKSDQYEETLSMYEDILAYSKKQGDSSLFAKINAIMGYFYAKRRDYKKAKYHDQIALETYKAIGHRNHLDPIERRLFFYRFLPHIPQLFHNRFVQVILIILFIIAYFVFNALLYLVLN